MIPPKDEAAVSGKLVAKQRKIGSKQRLWYIQCPCLLFRILQSSFSAKELSNFI